MTVAALAQALDCSVAAVYRYRKREVQCPPANIVVRLADTLGCTTDEVLGRDPNRPQQDDSEIATVLHEVEQKLGIANQKIDTIARQLEKSQIMASLVERAEHSGEVAGRDVGESFDQGTSASDKLDAWMGEFEELMLSLEAEAQKQMGS
jgi:hypothetical protein